METVKLTIDSKQVEVPKGTTIYKAAKSMGIDIPVLCYMDLHDLGVENKPAGCRICVVEIAGRRNLAPSCSTVCMEGMEVKTHTTRVINARRTVMELLLSDHPRIALHVLKVVV
jgi:NADH dehydrogenase/NADH:ubiquinone oxidoreductase 75 kD subunit (chain G)